jgi:short-subunit dehydrogenase involved in D-alanine esterification of teichoic acids
VQARKTVLAKRSVQRHLGGRTKIMIRTAKFERLLRQVATSCGDLQDDYDIEKIVEEIIARYPNVEFIDEMPDGAYWGLITKHDISGKS